MRSPCAPIRLLFKASLGVEEAEKVRRFQLAGAIVDYPKFKSGVKTLFGKFEFEVFFRAQLRNHSQSNAESIATYAALTTEVCSKAYPAFATETQLSLAVEHFISGIADATTPDYLLHDRALRTLTWQKCVQIAQGCKASRLLLNESANAVAAVSTKVDAHALAERTCAPNEITAAFAWQAKSARDKCVSGGAHLSRKEDSRARASATRSSSPKKNYYPSAARDSQSPCPKSDNSPRAHAEPPNNSRKSRPARKCYACGGIGHIARVCPTRTEQSAANASCLLPAQSRLPAEALVNCLRKL